MPWHAVAVIGLYAPLEAPLCRQAYVRWMQHGHMQAAGIRIGAFEQAASLTNTV